jgi:hypothetical protein
VPARSPMSARWIGVIESAPGSPGNSAIVIRSGLKVAPGAGAEQHNASDALAMNRGDGGPTRNPSGAVPLALRPLVRRRRPRSAYWLAASSRAAAGAILTAITSGDVQDLPVRRKAEPRRAPPRRGLSAHLEGRHLDGGGLAGHVRARRGRGLARGRPRPWLTPAGLAAMDGAPDVIGAEVYLKP